VTRLSDTEFSVSANDRWGESLETGVSRVLSQNLSSDLPGLQVVPFPWSRKTEIDYKITVEFQHLERTADGTADVQAIWTVRSGADNKVVDNGTTTASEPAGSDQRSASAALSDGIAQVSREIAQALQSQAQQRTATQ
jgi:uncharacterized lipoprotein YmbA